MHVLIFYFVRKIVSHRMVSCDPMRTRSTHSFVCSTKPERNGLSSFSTTVRTRAKLLLPHSSAGNRSALYVCSGVVSNLS